MIWKKQILTNLFIAIGIIGVFATPQIPDKLIYNGDTLSVYLYLPNEFYKPDTVPIGQYESIYTVNLFGDKKTCISTACGRKYQATWEILENQLYLTGIYSCCYYEDNIKADLTSLFKEKVINGKVKADWVTGNVFFQKGKMITRIDAELSIYETDFEFEFSEGKLLNVKSYDNSKSRISIYSQNQEKLIDFIYSNIDWNNLPISQERVSVNVRFSANENGKVDEVKIMRGDNETFNKEAIRVVKLIPEWDVFYIRGKHFRFYWNLPIIFSEENREKYGK